MSQDSASKSNAQTQRIVFAIALGAALLFLFGPAIAAGEHPIYRDGGHWYAPLWQWACEQWSAGSVPLWDPLQNLGESHIADGTSSVFYPGKLLFAFTGLLGGFSRTYTIFLAGHIFIAAALMFRLCRRWQTSTGAASIAALSYAFSGSVFYQIYNAPFLIGAAWLPLAISSTVDLVTDPNRKAAVRLGIALGLIMLGGDSQMIYHVVLVLAVLLVGNGLTSRGSQSPAADELVAPGTPRVRGKSVMLACLALGIGFALAAVQIMPSAGRVASSERSAYESPRSIWELSKEYSAAETTGESIDLDGLLARTKPGTHHDRAYQFSVAPWRFIELLYPNIFGCVLPQNTRWIAALPAEGRTWTPSIYFGFVPLICALVALRRRKNIPPPFRWMGYVGLFFAIAAMGVYGLGWFTAECARAFGVGGIDGSEPAKVGWGFGGLYWMINTVLPGYVYFRYPAKLWVLATCGFSVLAAAGWDELFRNSSSTLPKVLQRLNWLGIASLISAGVSAAVGLKLLLSLAGPKGDSVFGPMQLNAAAHAISFSLIRTTVLCFLFSLLLRYQSNAKVALLLLLLVTVDLAESQRHHVITGRPADRQIASDQSMNEPPKRAYRSKQMLTRPAEWGEQSDADRMHQVVDWDYAHLAPQHHHQQSIGLVNSRTSIDSQRWLQILKLARSQTGKEIDPQFLKYLGIGIDAARLPRAWIAEEVVVLPSIDPSNQSAAKNRLTEIFYPDGKLRDLRRQAVIEVSSGKSQILAASAVPLKSGETCEFDSYTPNRIEINVNVSHRRLLVLADTYDRGWRAYEWRSDATVQQPVELVCVNGCMRGMWVDEDTSQVSLQYLPNSLLFGGILSALGWGSCLLYTFGLWARPNRLTPPSH